MGKEEEEESLRVQKNAGFNEVRISPQGFGYRRLRQVLEQRIISKPHYPLSISIKRGGKELVIIDQEAQEDIRLLYGREGGPSFRREFRELLDDHIENADEVIIFELKRVVARNPSEEIRQRLIDAQKDKPGRLVTFYWIFDEETIISQKIRPSDEYLQNGDEGLKKASKFARNPDWMIISDSKNGT